jgi:hypothetical protein
MRPSGASDRRAKDLFSPDHMADNLTLARPGNVITKIWHPSPRNDCAARGMIAFWLICMIISNDLRIVPAYDPHDSRMNVQMAGPNLRCHVPWDQSKIWWRVSRIGKSSDCRVCEAADSERRANLYGAVPDWQIEESDVLI